VVAIPGVSARELETVFVEAPSDESNAPVSETHHLLEQARLDRLQPRSLSDALRRLPSAHLPTNSRGETLLYLRGAGERQVAVFLDGALLNIPWDNRADLSQLPASIIGRAVTATGTLSPQYGVNALGALALFPRETLANDASFSARFGLGSEATRSAQVAAAGGEGERRWIAIGRHGETDGAALSSDALVPFHQASTSVRTNTDQRSGTAVLRGRWGLEEGSVAATVLWSEGARGIAPESDRASGSRFWRYPRADLAMAIVTGHSALGSTQDVTGSLWLQSAAQDIDSYADDRYQRVIGQELSEDDTLGLRGIHRVIGERFLLSGSVNLLATEHKQRDVVVGQTSVAPELAYRQVTSSLGVDFETELGRGCGLEAGLGVDQANYTATADKPAFERQSDPTWRLGIACGSPEALRWHLAVGKKARFPTMRELFGTALNRFLLNPDLRSEQIETAEAGLEWRRGNLNANVNLFTQHVDDAISERRVGALRQRINIDGTRILGIELASRWAPPGHWALGLNATVFDGKRRGFSGDEEHLIERPEQSLTGYVEYTADSGLALTLEVERLAEAWSVTASNQVAALPDSTQLNAHISREIGSHAELGLHVLNLTDDWVQPQFGLPAAGRSAEVILNIHW